MAVKVYLIDGSTEHYPAATAAVNHDPAFVVATRNTQKRRPSDEVAWYQSDQVLLAQVFENGILKDVISGSGRRQPKLT